MKEYFIDKNIRLCAAKYTAVKCITDKYTILFLYLYFPIKLIFFHIIIHVSLDKKKNTRNVFFVY
jgi:hypothetical protein